MRLYRCLLFFLFTVSGLFAKAPAFGKKLVREIYDPSGERNFVVKPDGDHANVIANKQWDRPVVITYGLNNHAVQTERWRYIRYRDGGQELYDHERDPNEWTNLASIPKYSPQKTKLAKWLPSTNGEPKK